MSLDNFLEPEGQNIQSCCTLIFLRLFIKGKLYCPLKQRIILFLSSLKPFLFDSFYRFNWLIEWKINRNVKLQLFNLFVLCVLLVSFESNILLTVWCLYNNENSFTRMKIQFYIELPVNWDTWKELKTCYLEKKTLKAKRNIYLLCEKLNCNGSLSLVNKKDKCIHNISRLAHRISPKCITHEVSRGRPSMNGSDPKRKVTD